MKMIRCKAFFVSLHLKIDFLCNKNWVASKTYFHWVNCPFYLFLVKLSFNNNEATLTSMETSLHWRLNWCWYPPKDNSKTSDLPHPTPNNVELKTESVEMSPFMFGVTTLAGELGGRGVMNPKSTQTLWLHVGTEFYVTITWEDFLNVSRVLLTFSVENEVAPLHTCPRTCSK